MTKIDLQKLAPFLLNSEECRKAGITEEEEIRAGRILFGYPSERIEIEGLKSDRREELLRKAYLSIASTHNHSFSILEKEDEEDREDTDVYMDGDKATVRIQGPIDPYWGVDLRAIIKTLLEKKPKSIHVEIETPGGYSADGMTFYNEMRKQAQKGVEVSTETCGLCASAGAFIFLSGDKRKMSDVSELMIHAPWSFGFPMGDYWERKKQHRNAENALWSGTVTTAKVVSKRSTDADLTEERAMGWLRAGDKWFDADRALKLGLATEVIEDTTSKKDGNESGETQQSSTPSPLISLIAGGIKNSLTGGQSND